MTCLDTLVRGVGQCGTNREAGSNKSRCVVLAAGYDHCLTECIYSQQYNGKKNMNRLFWIGVIFAATTFLLINTFSLSSAYGCNNSTNTNRTAGVNGTSVMIEHVHFSASSCRSYLL